MCVDMFEDLTLCLHICACVSVCMPWVGGDRKREQEKYLWARPSHFSLQKVPWNRSKYTMLLLLTMALALLYPGKFGAATLKKIHSFLRNVFCCILQQTLVSALLQDLSP